MDIVEEAGLDFESPLPHVVHMGAFRHASRTPGVTPAPQPALIRSIHFSDDGLHCVSASGDGKVRLYDVGSVALCDQIALPCAKAAFSHSSNILVTTPSHTSNATVGFLDVERGAFVSAVEVLNSSASMANWGLGKRERSSPSSDMGPRLASSNSNSAHTPILAAALADLRATPMGPLATTLSVSPVSDVVCIGCSSGATVLVEPTLPRPLTVLSSPNSDDGRAPPVVGTAFSPCGRYIAVATTHSVEAFVMANLGTAVGYGEGKDSRVKLFSMPEFHRRHCTGYASVSFGMRHTSSSAAAEGVNTASVAATVVAACGCGGVDVLSFNGDALVRVGGHASDLLPERLFPRGGGLAPHSTGLPFIIPQGRPGDEDSADSAPEVVCSWQMPSCGVALCNPSALGKSLVLQGTMQSRSTMDVKGQQHTYQGVIVRDPFTFEEKKYDGSAQVAHARAEDVSLARVFLSTSNDPGGVPRAIAANPRFAIVAAAHRVLNWWALL